MGIKYNYEDASKIVDDLGYYLLSKEYINARTKLNIRDVDGYLYSITLGGLLSGKRPEYLGNSNPFLIQNIKHFLVKNNSKSILMSIEIKNCKCLIDFKCECGTLYQCSIDKMSNRQKITCNECSLTARGFNHRIPFEDVFNLFKKESLTPLFSKYEGCYDGLLCKDEFGYIGLLSYHKLKQGGKFDMVSKYNPYSIDNIKNYIILNNLKCEIVSDDFTNANSKLKFKCMCGKIYETIWRTFMTSHNDRCPRCSKKQSKYAYEVEQYLIHNKFIYDKEYTFEDCRNINVLSYDFIIFLNCGYVLLEVDGETHFEPAWKGMEGLLEQQRTDGIKNQYCINKNIKLIRIAYKQINDKSYINILEKELSKNIS